MADSFFSFNTALPGLSDEELQDEPGQGLDEEEEEEYDALNDETFGNDALEGDWEEDHEKLAESIEQSRARSGSYNTDGAERAEDPDNDSALDLEASLAQLVLDDYDEDVIVENGARNVKLQNHRHLMVEDDGNYSSSAPSGYSVWSPTKRDIQLQNSRQIAPSILPGKSVVSVEELERGLLSQRQQQQQQQQQQQSQPKQHPSLIVPPPPGLGPPASSSVLRLEDVERDLAASASLPPPMGRGQIHPQHPDMVLLRNTQNTAAVGLGRGFPGRLPPPKGPVLPLLLPGNRLMGPGPIHHPLGLADLRNLPQQNHRLMGSAPNLLRFVPPHLMGPAGQGKGMPHPGNGILMAPGLGGFHPGLPHLDQHRQGGQGLFGGRPDRNLFYSNNRNGLSNNFHHNRGVHHNYHHHNRGNQNHQEYDEYAGLMTLREKQWLLNIQLLQLNTDKPHIDDYYYTVFQSRRPKSEMDKERDRTRDMNRERRDSFRDRDPKQEQQQQQPRVYTPAQFENSLGKLQVGSVTAPRKIIDMDVVSPEGMDVIPVTNQRDTRRVKQVLLEIERLYLLVLQIEDLTSPIPGVQDAVTEEKSALLQKVMNGLLTEDRLVSILCIRKGKMLLLRLLPLLPTTDNGPPQLLTMWCRVLRGLIAIGRRDPGPDATLPRFHPYFHQWVAMLPFAPLLQLAKSMLPAQDGPSSGSTPTPTRTISPVGRNVLVYAMGNKFGISALASMLERAEVLFPELENSQQQEWKAFLVHLFDAAGHVPPPESLPTPLEPLPSKLASVHLGRCENVHIERYALLERVLTRRNSMATPSSTEEKINEN